MTRKIPWKIITCLVQYHHHCIFQAVLIVLQKPAMAACLNLILMIIPSCLKACYPATTPPPRPPFLLITSPPRRRRFPWFRPRTLFGEHSHLGMIKKILQTYHQAIRDSTRIITAKEASQEQMRWITLVLLILLLQVFWARWHKPHHCTSSKHWWEMVFSDHRHIYFPESIGTPNSFFAWGFD